MADRIPPTVDGRTFPVEGPCVLPSGETPKQHSSGSAPSDLAEDRLDDACARFSLGDGERRLCASSVRGLRASSWLCLHPRPLFHERLGAQQPDRAIGFLDREGPLLSARCRFVRRGITKSSISSSVRPAWLSPLRAARGSRFRTMLSQSA